MHAFVYTVKTTYCICISCARVDKNSRTSGDWREAYMYACMHAFMQSLESCIMHIQRIFAAIHEYACLRERTYAKRACTIAHCAYAAWTSLRLHVHARVHAYAHVCMVAYLSMGMSNATQARYVCMVAYLPMGMCKRAFTHLCS
jgi:hypothetical protein